MKNEKQNEAEISIEVRDSGIKRVTVIADNADEQARAHKLLARIASPMRALDDALRGEKKRTTKVSVVVSGVLDAELKDLDKWEQVLVQEISQSYEPTTFARAFSNYRKAVSDFCYYVAARMQGQPILQEEIDVLDSDSKLLLQETVRMTGVLAADDKHGVTVTHAPINLVS